MSVLVDTSVWAEYFKNGNNFEQLDFLIDENLVVTNNLILAELIPFLKMRNQKKTHCPFVRNKQPGGCRSLGSPH